MFGFCSEYFGFGVTIDEFSIEIDEFPKATDVIDGTDNSLVPLADGEKEVILHSNDEFRIKTEMNSALKMT